MADMNKSRANGYDAGAAPGAEGFELGGEVRLLERYNGLKLGWLHDSLRFILLLLALFLLFRYGIGLAIVGGDSMEPTLSDGDIVLYLRIVPAYRPGDIVSMRVPAGDYYVKRVAAVGGDRVELRDGAVFVNGEALDDPWGVGLTREETGAVVYPYAVRENNVFVLGDNREVSMDSRAFGEVNRRQIRGRILWRLNRQGLSRVGSGED